MAYFAGMRILVLRFSSIGDIVLCSPVFRCLKLQIPGIEIHFATKQSFASVVSANPYIDQLHLLGTEYRDFIQSLKAHSFDYIIDLHHNLRTRRISLELRVKTLRYHKLNFRKWLLTSFKINQMPERHLVDRLMDTIASLGVVNDGAGLDFFLSPENTSPALPAGFRPGQYTALVIGATYTTKRLPASHLIILCRKLQGPILLLGGKEDTGVADEIIKALGQNYVQSACGRWNLQQSAQLIKWSRNVITHDTGLMHIAAAFRKPIISIWGNTVPSFGMYPYYPSLENIPSYISEVPQLPCRPCSKIGYPACPQGHFKCMVNQDLTRIAAVQESLEG